MELCLKNRMKFLLTILIASACLGQDATTVMDAINLANHPPVTILTMTASQGDGTVCKASKVAGSTIYLTLACTSSGVVLNGTTLKATGTLVSSTTFDYGDVLCLFLVNPTATAIAATGSWTAIPAVSVGWQCSTNIRTAGSVSGQTALVAGSVSWP